MKRYENIKKIATGQEHDYVAVCLLYYPYFKELLLDDNNRFK